MSSTPDDARVMKARDERELEEQYASALDEWFNSSDAELWDSLIGDGLNEEDLGLTGQEPGQ